VREPELTQCHGLSNRQNSVSSAARKPAGNALLAGIEFST
jgi:hypothetical protein